MSKYEIGEKFNGLDELYDWVNAGNSVFVTHYAYGPKVYNCHWVLNQQIRYLALHLHDLRKTIRKKQKEES